MSFNYKHVVLVGIDGAGHTYGYGTEKYLEALSGADEWVGAIRKAIEDAGIAEDTLYIVTADHGGDYNPDQWRHIPGTLDQDFRLFPLAGINSVSVGIFAWAFPHYREISFPNGTKESKNPFSAISGASSPS